MRGGQMPGTHHLDAVAMGGDGRRGSRPRDNPGHADGQQGFMGSRVAAVSVGIADIRPERTCGYRGEERQYQAIEIHRPEEDEAHDGQPSHNERSPGLPVRFVPAGGKTRGEI